MPLATPRARLLRALALSTALALPSFAPMPAFAQPPNAPASFADLAAKLLPAVVNISASQSVQARADRPGGPEVPSFPPGSPFEQFFRDFLERNRPRGPQGTPRGDQDNGPGGGPARRMQALGSGFIIDPAGYVVTNNHVIADADEITVTLQDNTSLKAKLIGKDERTDIVVLKVDSDKPLPAVPFGDSDNSRVGDWVLAIGNPFGLGGSVTAGIVSARGRDIRQGPYDDFIQTDAAINRGNSGGPLFNMSGEVVGINTAIYSPSGGSIGIGFSIPANLAKNVVAQLRDYGHARRGWLGVSIQQVTPDIAESLGLHTPEGALVGRVNDGGPADKAGIRAGDIVQKFNNQDIKEMKALPRVVAETGIGQSVPVQVWRNGKQQNVQVTVGELPEDIQQAGVTQSAPAKPAQPQQAEIAGLGLKLSPINDDLRGKYNLNADQKGVVVTDVAQGSPAADRGMKAGDVIMEVQQEPVATPADVQDKVDRVRKQQRKSVLMLIQGSDGMRWVPLPVSADQDRKRG